MDATQIIQQAVRTEISNALASAEIPIIKYGTVTSVATSGTMQIILDGDTAATACVSCCSTVVSDRVVVVVHNRQALAIAVIGHAEACPLPVGAYLFDDGATTPPAIWAGTTWERILDRFPLAAGNTYASGSTGGEAAHALTSAENGPHVHYFHDYWNLYDATGGGGRLGASYNTYGNDGGVGTTSSGSGAAHNNMPPYLAIPLWHRVA
jgi:hypothetical protein